MAMLARAEALPSLVSVGGGVTEIVYALEAQSQLLGVDTSSTWPIAATELPQVGYQRSLSAEGVLSLRPDVLLASQEAGPPHVLAQLSDAGVDVVLVDGDYSFAGLLKRIALVGEASGRDGEAAVLRRQLSHQWQRLQQRIHAAPPVNDDGGRLRVAVLMVHGGVVMAAGAASGGDAMLRMAGAENAYAGLFQGYKPVSAEAMVAAAPDVVVVTQGNGDPLGIDGLVSRVPGLALTPAGRDRHIVAVDIVAFLGFGPRMPGEVSRLYQALAGSDE